MTSRVCMLTLAACVLTSGTVPAIAQPREPGVWVFPPAGGVQGSSRVEHLSWNGRFATLTPNREDAVMGWVWEGGATLRGVPEPDGLRWGASIGGISDDGRVIGFANTGRMKLEPMCFGVIEDGAARVFCEVFNARTGFTDALVSADGSAAFFPRETEFSGMNNIGVGPVYVWNGGESYTRDLDPTVGFRAKAMSADGTTFAGWSYMFPENQLMFWRRGAPPIIRPDITDGDTWAINAEGTILVGRVGARAARWEGDLNSMTFLPASPGATYAAARAVSNDGGLIFGFESGVGTSVWRGNRAPMSQTEYLTRRGLPPPEGYSYYDVTHVSADGRTVAGDALRSGNWWRDPFIAVLPCRADFNNDGELTFDDIASFVAQYNAQTLRADLNEDGEWTFEDVQIFIAAYNGGDC